MPQIQLPDFIAITFGLITYLLGEGINNRVPVLRRFNIPDPVTGGLLVALGFFALQRLGVAEVSFDTHSRDILLLIFFTGIGLNARIADLLKGGKPLGILVLVTAALLILQNLIGGLGAWIAGLPMGFGVVFGSTSLLGGHGTIIAWSPELAARGLAGAPEAGMAMATLGLVVASVIGGPIGRLLIERGKLSSDEPDDVNPVGLSDTAPPSEVITRNALMRTLLVIFICILVGFVVQQAILELGLLLPLFVPCLFVGMIVGNLMGLAPFLAPVSHTPALSLVSEFALGVFLAVSLMALQLWALAGHGRHTPRRPAGPDRAGHRRSPLHRLPLPRPRLPGRRAQRRLCQLRRRRDPHRHRHHDRRHQALRPEPVRLHRAALGLRRLRRHRQRPRHPGLPQLLDALKAPFRTEKPTVLWTVGRSGRPEQTCAGRGGIRGDRRP